MKTTYERQAASPLHLLAIAACAGLAACDAPTGGASTTGTAAATTSAAAPASAAPKASASAAPSADAAAADAKKKADDAAALEADKANLETEQAAELARFTPELRAATKALVEKPQADAKAAIAAVVAGKHRKPGHAERDADRHPVETLAFFGVKPTSKVLELSPGEGWFTELLAPLVAKSGKLAVTSTDPAGPATERATLYGLRTKRFLERSPEAYGKVEVILVDSKAPKLGHAGAFDTVVISRALHGMVNGGTLKPWLAEVHQALATGGVLGVEQHRAAVGADPTTSSKLGYLPEAWVIEQIQGAGFKLEEKSEINANPKDTKDHPEGVWALPPTFRLKDKDRAKYAAIGESDRMTLKFVKVALAK